MVAQTPIYEIRYPESTDDVRLWEHMQTLASDTDDALVRVAAFGNSTGFTGVGGTGTTTGATYVDIASTNNAVSFTKLRDDTRLKLELFVNIFTATATSKAGIALQANGVDYDIDQLSLDTTSTYRKLAGVNYSGVFNAGTYTVKARWKRISGTGTLSIDGAGFISMAITEVA